MGGIGMLDLRKGAFVTGAGSIGEGWGNGKARRADGAPGRQGIWD